MQRTNINIKAKGIKRDIFKRSNWERSIITVAILEINNLVAPKIISHFGVINNSLADYKSKKKRDSSPEQH